MSSAVFDLRWPRAVALKLQHHAALEVSSKGAAWSYDGIQGHANHCQTMPNMTSLDGNKNHEKTSKNHETPKVWGRTNMCG